MRNFFSLVSSLCFVFLATACARPDYISRDELNPSQADDCALTFTNSQLCLTVTWLNGPTVSGSSDFEVRFWDKNTGNKNGPYVNPPGTLGVLLWMPSMSHGSAPVTITPLAPGEFKVTNVYFIMPKDWEVRFSLENNGQVTDQDALELIL